MKTLKFLLFILLATALVGCGNDDDDNWDFNQDSLKQTIWEGTYENRDYNENENVKGTDNVILEFYTTTNGQTIIINQGQAREILLFTYSIDGKIVDFKNGFPYGKYTVLEFRNDKMVLVLLGNDKITITLHRKY